MPREPGDDCIRVAAAGDVHCRADGRERAEEAFASLAGDEVDLVVLCGDLTAHGLPAEAAVLGAACRQVPVPVVAVLGNHDWHSGRHDELVAVLSECGVTVLEGGHAIVERRGVEVGVAGVKGFVGGFGRARMPDFGEPSLRALHRETGEDVAALDRALHAIELCAVRIVAMHYAPVPATVEGEPVGIWPFLGSDRFAAPIAEHEPDLVLHGHAHAGSFEGAVGDVPVYNVSVPVIDRDFWVFELACRPAQAPIH